ncbi:hypothetical protein N431DRAFT_27563 [Stipitochalara longipes BDJ]|nr:hypothetical protein N431DRAFT_27563 [Stipitochalara longipes BDJ]
MMITKDGREAGLQYGVGVHLMSTAFSVVYLLLCLLRLLCISLLSHLPSVGVAALLVDYFPSMILLRRRDLSISDSYLMRMETTLYYVLEIKRFRIRWGGGL